MNNTPDSQFWHGVAGEANQRAEERGAVRHTPGPWEWKNREIVGAVGTESERFVAIMTDPHLFPVQPANMFSDDWPVAMADARLISAAPDLLAALRQALHDHDECPCCRNYWRTEPHEKNCKLIAALWKAEGATE